MVSELTAAVEQVGQRATLWLTALLDSFRAAPCWTHATWRAPI